MEHDTREQLADTSVGGGTPPSRSFRFFSLLFGELFALTGIIAVGWFLIGYYTKFEFLQTGYQDWIYNAFRIRDISQFGISSWDHIWGNGINHWRAFQYVSYVAVFLIVKITGLSITKAMLWLSAVIFVLVRVLVYGVLRVVHVGRVASFFAVIASYAISQQWTALKEFSIYIGLIVVPLYVFLWIFAARDKKSRNIYLVTAVAGASWSIHPVVGYSLSGMLGMLILTSEIRHETKRLFILALIFFVSSAPFTIPFFLSGYNVSNPFYVTPQFMRTLLVSDGYLGLSISCYIFAGLSWLILLVKSEESPRWAKLLLFYCTGYIVFIYFGLLGYYPEFINKFQFSRAIPLISILLSFCFAAFAHVAFSSTRSRLVTSVFLALSSALIAQSISIASIYSGQPVSSIQDPVAIYFSSREFPKGGIYFRNVSEASYLSNSGLRFITSYNQHLLSNPYPMRFDSLMKTDIAYTGATDQQIDLINDYATVLGVEYIFVPKLSPLASGLTVDRAESKAFFEQVGEVAVPSDTYVVLRSRFPITNAYVFESDRTRDLLRFDDIPKPTLQATSYRPWDEEIRRMARLIRNGDLKPVNLSFEWPDGLVVDGSEISSFRNPSVLINQSYDVGWSVTNTKGVQIEPTSLRFMHLSFSSGLRSDRIVLKNSWPWWHWPVQTLGIVSIFLTAIAFWFSNRKRKISSESILNS